MTNKKVAAKPNKQAMVMVQTKQKAEAKVTAAQRDR
jgi:hypothetical protein